MRILAIQAGNRSDTKRVHFDFLAKLSTTNDFFVYGPDEHLLNSEETTPLKFNKELILSDVIKEFDPEVVILPEFALITSKPFDLFKETLLSSPVPLVLLEVDSYNVEDFSWYPAHDIDLIIERAPDANHSVPSVWLPFSANEEFFTTDEDRINNLVFVGGGRYSKNKYYATRQLAIRTLETEGLVDYRGECGEKPYPDLLRKYIGALSCSFPPLYHTPAKTFEIMASGTALLTTKLVAGKKLFGDEQCYFTYNEDCSDIVDIALEMLYDKDKTKEVVQNALSVVNKKHLDKHRIVELQNILEAVVYGKEIPDVWGIR